MRLPFGIRWIDACTGMLSLTLLGQALFLFANFRISRTISLEVDVVSAAFTLFLALYIPAQLARQLQSRRYEGELLINRLQQIEEVVMDIRQRVHDGTAPATLSAHQTRQLLVAFTTLNQQLDLTRTLITDCTLSDTQRGMLLTQLSDLEQARGELQDLTTGERFAPGSPFSFPWPNAKVIGFKVQDIRRICQRLTLSVNRES